MRKCGAASLKLDTHSTYHMTHTATLPWVVTYRYLWVRYMWVPGAQVQSHLLQELLCKHAYVIKPGSYGTNPLSLYKKAISIQVQWTILFNTLSKDFPKGPFITSHLNELLFRATIYQRNTCDLDE